MSAASAGGDPANSVILVGVIVDAPDLRRSPAGVPVTRFLLEHRSAQPEAGTTRAIRFRVGVRASGDGPGEYARGLAAGETVRVEGFLARIRQHEGENRLIVCATRIERLPDGQ